MLSLIKYNKNIRYCEKDVSKITLGMVINTWLRVLKKNWQVSNALLCIRCLESFVMNKMC